MFNVQARLLMDKIKAIATESASVEKKLYASVPSVWWSHAEKDTTYELVHIWESMWDNGYEALMNSKNHHNALGDVVLHFNNLRMRCFYTDRTTNTTKEFDMTDYFNYDTDNGDFTYDDDDSEYMDEDVFYEYEINIGGERNGVLIDTTTNEEYRLHVNSASFDYFDKIHAALQSHMDAYHIKAASKKEKKIHATIELHKYRMLRITEVFHMLNKIYPSVIGYNKLSSARYDTFINKCDGMTTELDTLIEQHRDHIDEEYMMMHTSLKSLLRCVKDNMSDWRIRTCICLNRMELQGSCCPDVSSLIKDYI